MSDQPHDILCPRCGTTDHDVRAHTFDACIRNLRSLLGRYANHVGFCEGVTFLDTETYGRAISFVSEDERKFIKVIADAENDPAPHA